VCEVPRGKVCAQCHWAVAGGLPSLRSWDLWRGPELHALSLGQIQRGCRGQGLWRLRPLQRGKVHPIHCLHCMHMVPSWHVRARAGDGHLPALRAWQLQRRGLSGMPAVQRGRFLPKWPAPALPPRQLLFHRGRHQPRDVPAVWPWALCARGGRHLLLCLPVMPPWAVCCWQWQRRV